MYTPVNCIYVYIFVCTYIRLFCLHFGVCDLIIPICGYISSVNKFKSQNKVTFMIAS